MQSGFGEAFAMGGTDGRDGRYFWWWHDIVESGECYLCLGFRDIESRWEQLLGSSASPSVKLYKNRRSPDIIQSHMMHFAVAMAWLLV